MNLSLGVTGRTRLTQGGVVTQFRVIALEALFGSPPVVPSPHDDVDFLVPVLTHVSAEYSARPVTADGVSAVHGAPPHVSDPVGVHLRTGVAVAQEGVVRRDPVRRHIRLGSVNIDAEDFSQECTPVDGCFRRNPEDTFRGDSRLRQDPYLFCAFPYFPKGSPAFPPSPVKMYKCPS